MRKINRSYSLLFVAFLFSSAFTLVDAPERFCNGRYNFCVTYPAEVFSVQELSPNNDGVYMTSPDSDVEMRVTGYYNIMGWTLEDEYTEILETIQSESRDQIKSAKPTFSAGEMSAIIEMGVLSTYIQIVEQGDHFVSLIIVTNRQGLNRESHRISSLLSKINLEVGTM